MKLMSHTGRFLAKLRYPTETPMARFSTIEDAVNAAQAQLIRALITVMGDNPDRPGLQETPRRVLESYKELFAGYDQDPTTLLKVFEEECDELVLQKDIPFVSTCEHHLLPFYGVAHVAYIPGSCTNDKKRIVGLSKLARLVEVYARRLQIQERICVQVTRALMEEPLMAHGAACVIEAEHMCMGCRGVKKPGSKTVTSSLLGVFFTDPRARAEVLSLIRSK